MRAKEGGEGGASVGVGWRVSNTGVHLQWGELLEQVCCSPTACLLLLAHSLLVHSLAVFSYSALLVLYKCAISGTRGSSGLGSFSRLQMDRSTLLMVRAGLLQGSQGGG